MPSKAHTYTTQTGKTLVCIHYPGHPGMCHDQSGSTFYPVLEKEPFGTDFKNPNRRRAGERGAQ